MRESEEETKALVAAFIEHVKWLRLNDGEAARLLRIDATMVGHWRKGEREVKRVADTTRERLQDYLLRVTGREAHAVALEALVEISLASERAIAEIRGSVLQREATPAVAPEVGDAEHGSLRGRSKKRGSGPSEGRSEEA